MMGTAGLLKNPMFGSCSPEALPLREYAPGQQLHSALFSLINSDNGGISLCQAAADTAYAVTAPPATQLIHHRH